MKVLLFGSQVNFSKMLGKPITKYLHMVRDIVRVKLAYEGHSNFWSDVHLLSLLSYMANLPHVLWSSRCGSFATHGTQLPLLWKLAKYRKTSRILENHLQIDWISEITPGLRFWMIKSVVDSEPSVTTYNAATVFGCSATCSPPAKLKLERAGGEVKLT